MQNVLRDEEQRKSVEILLKNKSTTILLPTGYGKTRVGTLAAEAIGGSILVVTSRVNLVDN